MYDRIDLNWSNGMGHAALAELDARSAQTTEHDDDDLRHLESA